MSNFSKFMLCHCCGSGLFGFRYKSLLSKGLEKITFWLKIISLVITEMAGKCSNILLKILRYHSRNETQILIWEWSQTAAVSPSFQVTTILLMRKSAHISYMQSELLQFGRHQCLRNFDTMSVKGTNSTYPWLAEMYIANFLFWQLCWIKHTVSACKMFHKCIIFFSQQLHWATELMLACWTMIPMQRKSVSLIYLK